jgi:putative endonuclease
MKRRETGILGEKLARELLKKRGYKIIETNYRCPHGEIDIVARKKDTIVFIEVRTKKSLDFGSPEESITPVKKERMRNTAFYYCQTHDDIPSIWRIDLVAIELDQQGKPSRIDVLENAVGEDS